MLCVCVLRRQLESFYHSMTRHVPQKKKKSYCCFSMNSSCNWTMTHQKYARQIHIRPSPPTHPPTHKHAAAHRNTPDRRHMRHAATRCNTLQHTATHYNTLQHTAAHCSKPHRRHIQHTATHCNTLQHTATHCNTPQHTATHCNTYSTLQHTATLCNTLQHTATH